MNQKNIFMVIGVILLLQGIAFYAMGDKVVTDAFPNIDEIGKHATIPMMQVVSMTSIIIGLVSIAARYSPQVLWAYTLGFGLFSLNSIKHLLVDHINVPIPALIIQIGITLVCGYLWMQSRKTVTS